MPTISTSAVSESFTHLTEDCDTSFFHRSKRTDDKLPYDQSLDGQSANAPLSDDHVALRSRHSKNAYSTDHVGSEQVSQLGRSPGSNSTDAGSPVNEIYSEPAAFKLAELIWGRKDLEFNSHLCTICRRINFAEIFALDPTCLPVCGLPVFQFPKSYPEQLNEACEACRVFSAMPAAHRKHWSSAYGVYMYHLRAFPSDVVIGEQRNSGSAVIICLVRASIKVNFVNPISMQPWRSGFLWHHSPIQAPKNNPPCLSLEKQVNYVAVARMLANCCSTCKDTAGDQRIQFPCGVKVIDCVTQRIIPLLEGMVYFALSYVWGKFSDTVARASPTQSQYQGREGFVLGHPPQTVIDAMEFVKNVGHRYLWVDKYCILQDDNAHKTEQIAQMGKIYSSAIATICATGENADSGLLGVSHDRTRPPQFQAQHMIITRAKLPEFAIRDLLEQSVWSTRGWTYQEGILSQRCLFFTTEGLIQICDKTITGEIILSGHLTRSLGNYGVRSWSAGGMSSDVFVRREDSGRTSFEEEVQHYCQRTLTYPSDGFKAFKGVLSAMRVFSAWGVPIYEVEKSENIILRSSTVLKPSLEALGFICGLCWCNEPIDSGQIPEVQKSMLPSWSWVSARSPGIRFFFSEHDRPRLSFSSSVKTITMSECRADVTYAASVAFETISNSQKVLTQVSQLCSEYLCAVNSDARYPGLLELSSQTIVLSSIVVDIQVFALGYGAIRSRPLAARRVRYHLDGYFFPPWPKEQLLVGKTIPLLLLSISTASRYTSDVCFMMLEQMMDGSYQRIGLAIMYGVNRVDEEEEELLNWIQTQPVRTVRVS